MLHRPQWPDHSQELQLPSAREKTQLLRAPSIGRESLPILVCFSIRESVASQVFPTKLNVARTERVSKCHEREAHSCLLCRPSSKASSGKISSPSDPPGSGELQLCVLLIWHLLPRNILYSSLGRKCDVREKTWALVLALPTSPMTLAKLQKLYTSFLLWGK